MSYVRLFNPRHPTVKSFKIIGLRKYIESILVDIIDSRILFSVEPVYGAVSSEVHLELLIDPENEDQELIVKLLLS